jgi:hypothetical protein
MSSKDATAGPSAQTDTATQPERDVRSAVTRLGRYALGACYFLAIAYLCVLAAAPWVDAHAPDSLRWFGATGSYVTILVVLTIPLASMLLAKLAGRKVVGGTPVLLLAGMAASALALGLSSLWRCHDDQSAFFAPLSWTLGLFLGVLEPKYQIFDSHGAGVGHCGALDVPIGLELARLLAVSTTLTTAVAAALTLFRSQLDRLAVWRAHSLAVVVGIDDDAVSMVRALASRPDRNETLLVITGAADRPCVAAVRNLGARIREVSLADPDPLGDLRLWKKLDRLYLLSEDPTLNEDRLKAISAAMTSLGDTRRRLPLTVRIDDPWQAEVWRRNFLGDENSAPDDPSSRRWVADAVGRSEITAARLVRHMTTTTTKDGRRALTNPETVIVCGLDPLTYALSSELAQVHREHTVYARPHRQLPSHVVILATGAREFKKDHHLRQRRIAPGQHGISVEAAEAKPTIESISKHLAGHDPARCAVVLADPTMSTHGTRLALRFPELRIYQASSSAVTLPQTSIVGRLFSFPISMEIEPDAPQDAWERAAELIHERYSANADRQKWTARPWDVLDPFLKQSNRRQVINTLWLVEDVGQHTWNTLESPPAPPLSAEFDDKLPQDQLLELGFDTPIADQIMRSEHEDWCRFYHSAGWKFSEIRNDGEQRHDRLRPWADLMKQDDELRQSGASVGDERLNLTQAQRSLVGTLVSLRNLGYRSIPKPGAEGSIDTAASTTDWHHYRRRGVVSAIRRDHAWTWTDYRGEEKHANSGDWLVIDDGGDQRSFAADLFQASHDLISYALYRRIGTVEARLAIEEEVVGSREGDGTAKPGDWVVRGSEGEQWPVSAEKFRIGYEGPVD